MNHVLPYSKGKFSSFVEKTEAAVNAYIKQTHPVSVKDQENVIPKYLEEICFKDEKSSLKKFEEHFKPSYLKPFEEKV